MSVETRRPARWRRVLYCGLGLLGCGSLVALVTQSCSQALAPTGIDAPRSAPPAPSGQAQPAPAAPRPRVDLSGVVPLLALPEFEAAARAYDEGDPALAAQAAERVLSAQGGNPLADPRWALLLGRLREEGRDPARAELAYGSAAAAEWPLQDYARLGLARALRARDRDTQAVEALQSVPRGSQAFGAAQALLAKTACERGAFAKCLEHLQAFLQEDQRHRSWSVDAYELLAYGLVPELSAAASSTRPALTDASTRESLVVSTLLLLRRLQVEAPQTSARFDAEALANRLLSSLPPALQARHRTAPLEQQLERLRSEVNAERGREAERTSTALLALPNLRPEMACEVHYLRGRARTLQGQAERAEAEYALVASGCGDIDSQAKALFALGKQAFARKEYGAAELTFASLEQVAPAHRLADDARLYRAQAEKELDNDARFVALLDSLIEEYPEGDMAIDGTFQLALSFMEGGDWPHAAELLGRAVSAPNATRRAGPDQGRERYFLGRALEQTGAMPAALDQFEALLNEVPLSYYALHAYTRLWALDTARASSALSRVITQAAQIPFGVSDRGELRTPAFWRALELFRQGQIQDAEGELRRAGVLGEALDPELGWAAALLLSQAGETRRSHALVRWELSDWLQRWPVGEWRRAWEVAYPRPYRGAVTRNAAQVGIDEALVYAIMREESAFNETVVSAANAYGLMQLIPPTARHFAKGSGLPSSTSALQTPDVNIALGCRVLSDYEQRFPTNPLLVIPGYNAGPGRPQRWLNELPTADFDLWVELIPFRETRQYTKRVLASRATYRFLYKDPAHDALILPLRLAPQR